VVDLPGRRAILLGELYGTRDAAADVRRVAEGRLDPGSLNGHFALLIVAADGAVDLVTDRFGTVHLYYAPDSGGGWVAGTFCPGVAAAAGHRALDWEALAAFFEWGFFPADRTHFQGVRIVPPATRLRLAPGAGPVAARTWSWRHAPDHHRGFDATVDAFADVLREVMADHVGRAARVAVPISGGLDSRSTVAALDPAAEGRVWAYSYGYDDRSVETRIARSVAAVRGLPVEITTVGPYLFDRLDEVTAALEGFQDLTQARQAWVRDLLAERADRVVAAHWGDVWLDSVSPEKLASHADHVDVARSMVRKRGADWLLDQVAAPRLGGRAAVEESNRAFLERALAPLANLEDPAFRLKAFKTEAWSFRWTLASLRMHQAGAWPLLPFYDTRVTDLLISVPEEWLRGRRLQIEFLKRHAPDLARVTWQDADADLFTHPRSAAWKFGRRGVRWLGRRLSGRKVIQRNWEIQLSGENGSLELERWLVMPGLQLHDYVPRVELAQLVSRFLNAQGDREEAHPVCLVVALSSWLERYG